MSVVEAAGGVVWRAAGRAMEVLVVHRPLRDDWSFPKGKLEAGEGHESAAVREVEEETGYRCALGRHLGEVRYLDRDGRPKAVRYWEMTVIGGVSTVNAEVDAISWVPLAGVEGLLSYDSDRTVVARFRTTLRDGPGPEDGASVNNS